MKSENSFYLEELALSNVIASINTEDFSQKYYDFACEIANFDDFIIIAYYKERKPKVLFRAFRDPVVFMEMDSEYITGAYLLDPFYLIHLEGQFNGIVRLSETAPDQFKRTSYYNRYYKQTTLIDEVASFATINEEVTITACFGKDRSSGCRFSKKELGSFKKFENVLSVLMQKHWSDYTPPQLLKGNDTTIIEHLRSSLKLDKEIKISPRQAEVAMFILRGHSSRSIALNLEISIETVKVFRRQLYSKCNVSSQAELFALLMPVFSHISSKTDP